MEPSAAAAGFGHLFSWRHPATIDLNHAAYRYNQNMMEYYTCKSKFQMDLTGMACENQQGKF